MTFRHGIDGPLWFATSRVVAAYLGLTSKVRHTVAQTTPAQLPKSAIPKFVPGSIAQHKRCWRYRGRDVRYAGGGLEIANLKGRKVAYIAVARKLAVLVHHLWVTGQDFDPAR